MKTVTVPFREDLLQQIDKFATDNVRSRDDIIVETTRIYVERELKLVLDTNIFISSFFWGGNPRAIIKRIIIGQDILYTSEVILKETAGVLMRPKSSVDEQIKEGQFPSPVWIFKDDFNHYLCGQNNK
ncbi:MAG: PIN domain-containing protein [Dysgonamonadaceae bacterium]|nr:PIN domain-containing protein [Dysgonamonadaceae bacterium]